MSEDAADSERLTDLLGGHRITAAICAAVELGLIEALANGAHTAQDIAGACATDEPATGRLLTALVGLGVCERIELESFRLTEMGGQLVAASDRSLRDWALFEGKMLARSWLGLGDSIRHGKTLSELSGGAGCFADLSKDREAASMFDAAMISLTRAFANDILAAYDFSDAGRMLDVGGGSGALLIEILRAHPALTGCVLDLPHCEEGARRAFEDAGIAHRAKFIGGSFFDDIPAGFNTLVLKSVLHNWDDVRCGSILANCRRALGPVGTSLMIERLLPSRLEASSSFASVALNDLNMLRGPGGRERSEAHYRKLLADAGLSIATVLPAGRFAVLAANPA